MAKGTPTKILFKDTILTSKTVYQVNSHGFIRVLFKVTDQTRESVSSHIHTPRSVLKRVFLIHF